jgi:hypothetical protein
MNRLTFHSSPEQKACPREEQVATAMRTAFLGCSGSMPHRRARLAAILRLG